MEMDDDVLMIRGRRRGNQDREEVPRRELQTEVHLGCRIEKRRRREHKDDDKMASPSVTHAAMKQIKTIQLYRDLLRVATRVGKTVRWFH